MKVKYCRWCEEAFLGIEDEDVCSNCSFQMDDYKKEVKNDDDAFSRYDIRVKRFTPLQ